MQGGFDFRKALLFLAPGGLALYFFFDPALNLFPRCLFLQLTGWQCPGCGSQRALHALLHLDLPEAFALNPLMVSAIPYILLGLYLEYSKITPLKLRIRKLFFGYRAILIVLAMVVLFWILRNVL